MAIILIKGISVLVDDCDVVRVLGRSWQITGSKERIYFQNRYWDKNEKKYHTMQLHRFILGNALPVGMVVDHIDNNTLNNQKSNLRICSPTENAWNAGKSISNTSGFKGVTFHAQTNKWRAVIRVHGKLISLGLHETKEKAYAAYCKASEKYHGEYGRTV